MFNHSSSIKKPAHGLVSKTQPAPSAPPSGGGAFPSAPGGISPAAYRLKMACYAHMYGPAPFGGARPFHPPCKPFSPSKSLTPGQRLRQCQLHWQSLREPSPADRQRLKEQAMKYAREELLRAFQSCGQKVTVQGNAITFRL